ncbi:MAG TPA: hypothetical protein VNC50_14905 [Planctomycetia bacterium]|nr:hypothetical protein [Planctomycetia bacterium]
MEAERIYIPTPQIIRLERVRWLLEGGRTAEAESNLDAIGEVHPLYFAAAADLRRRIVDGKQGGKGAERRK